jgi:hypothetical protein
MSLAELHYHAPFAQLEVDEGKHVTELLGVE